MIYHDTDKDIKAVGKLLRNGEIVAIPTETVYGLAANAYDGNAVRKIFEAKRRPCDNPLIVHIADISAANEFAEPNEMFYKLAEKFMPGPITLIIPKKDNLPDEVCAGLLSVAVRYPDHPTTQKIIKAAGVPLAAPSANLSGSPSPTTAKHVIDDFGDHIPVLDAGKCRCGLESTVVSLLGGTPVLLRPGFITNEMLKKVLPNITIGQGVMEELGNNEKPLSPGLKHRHYAPKADTTGVRGKTENAVHFINHNSGNNTIVICFDEEKNLYTAKTISYGRADNPEQLASNLFDALRKADAGHPENIFIRTPETDGIGLAVYNRLLRATGFHIIDTDTTHTEESV